MTATYTLRYLTPDGTLLGVMPDLYSLSYTRGVNQSSTLSAVLPIRWASILDRNWRLEVWRDAGAGAYLDTETQWIVRRRTQRTDTSGREVCEIEAHSANILLRDRIALPYAGSPHTRKTGDVDDLMHEVFDETFRDVTITKTGTLNGSASVTGLPDVDRLFVGMSVAGAGIPADTRILSIDSATAITLSNSATASGSATLSFSLQILSDRAASGTFVDDLAAGATTSVSTAFAWKNVETICDELVDAARQAGEFVAYDLVKSAGGQLEFRTYVGQRGTDRTATLLPLGTDNGTLVNVSLIDDWRDEYSVVWAAGQGEGASRMRIGVVDDGRATSSLLGWREQMFDGRNYDTITDLYSQALARLRAGRKRVEFRGAIVNRPGNVYGVDWAWGDRVQAVYAGRTFEAHITAVKVAYQQGRETIDAWIEQDAI
jgi:hypothetical protein